MNAIKPGDVFGRLTVIGPGSVIKHHKKWVCRCLCGDVHEVFETNLLQGTATKCRACGHRSRNKYKSNTSGYVGVSFDKNNGKWQALIGYEGKLLFLGRYDTADDALAARNSFIVDKGLGFALQEPVAEMKK